MILAVLKDGSRHGYDITREVERRSGKQISFNDGTLYPVLHSLAKDGYISSVWEELPGERPRRTYTISEKGLTELERQVKAWRDFSKALDGVIGEEAPFAALLAGWGGRV